MTKTWIAHCLRLGCDAALECFCPCDECVALVSLPDPTPAMPIVLAELGRAGARGLRLYELFNALAPPTAYGEHRAIAGAMRCLLRDRRIEPSAVAHARGGPRTPCLS